MKLFGPDLVEEITAKIIKIRKNIQTVQNTQKSYTNSRRRDLEFEKCDRVFIKITHFKGISRFGKMRKLNSRFIEPFEILDRIGMTTNRLTLFPKLSRVYNVFHVTMLCKYKLDPSHILSHESL